MLVACVKAPDLGMIPEQVSSLPGCPEADAWNLSSSHFVNPHLLTPHLLTPSVHPTCSSYLLIPAARPICSFYLLILPAHHTCPSYLLIPAAHPTFSKSASFLSHPTSQSICLLSLASSLLFFSLLFSSTSSCVVTEYVLAADCIW
jgi:hypothetical protein